ALGIASGNINNGVFWTENPESNNPIWYIGDPGGSPFNNPPVAPTTPDARSTNEFPMGQFAVPNSSTGTPIPAVPHNGNIKIGAVAGSSLNNSTVYAAVTSPVGTLLNIYVTHTGGQSWAAVSAPPPNYMFTLGSFSSSILVTNANTVYLG